MTDLINDLYLPDFNKRQVRDGEAYKLLEKNKIDKKQSLENMAHIMLSTQQYYKQNHIKENI